MEEKEDAYICTRVIVVRNKPEIACSLSPIKCYIWDKLVRTRGLRIWCGKFFNGAGGGVTREFLRLLWYLEREDGRDFGVNVSGT